jgi:hypothetical protein
MRGGQPCGGKGADVELPSWGWKKPRLMEKRLGKTLSVPDELIVSLFLHVSVELVNFMKR